MPCDTVIKSGMTAQDRLKEINQAIERLEKQLTGGAVKLKVAPNGAILFEGWMDRDGVNDACAFQALQRKQSFALTTALAGQQFNQQAVASGLHSHDNGLTWGTH